MSSGFTTNGSSGYNTRSFGFVQGLISDDGSEVLISGDLNMDGNSINNVFNLTVNGCIQSSNPFVQICADLIVDGSTTTTSLQVQNNSIFNGSVCLPTGEPTNTTNLINVTTITGSPTSAAVDGIKVGSLVYDESNNQLFNWNGSSWVQNIDENNLPTLEEILDAGNTSGPHNLVLNQNLLIDGHIETPGAGPVEIQDSLDITNDLIVQGNIDVQGNLTSTTGDPHINIDVPIKNDGPTNVIIDDSLDVTGNLALSGTVSNPTGCVSVDDCLEMPSSAPTNTDNVLSLTTVQGVPTNLTVREGSLAWDENNDDLYIFDGTNWETVPYGTSGAGDLATVLMGGNNTGGTSIQVDTNDTITGQTDLVLTGENVLSTAPFSQIKVFNEFTVDTTLSPEFLQHGVIFVNTANLTLELPTFDDFNAQVQNTEFLMESLSDRFTNWDVLFIIQERVFIKNNLGGGKEFIVRHPDGQFFGSTTNDGIILERGTHRGHIEPVTGVAPFTFILSIETFRDPETPTFRSKRFTYSADTTIDTEAFLGGKIIVDGGVSSTIILTCPSAATFIGLSTGIMDPVVKSSTDLTEWHCKFHIKRQGVEVLTANGTQVRNTVGTDVSTLYIQPGTHEARVYVTDASSGSEAIVLEFVSHDHIKGSIETFVQATPTTTATMKSHIGKITHAGFTLSSLDVVTFTVEIDSCTPDSIAFINTTGGTFTGIPVYAQAFNFSNGSFDIRVRNVAFSTVSDIEYSYILINPV